MPDGDLYMTVTVEGATVPLLVTAPRTGRSVDDSEGQLPRSTGNAAQERGGSGAQESNGNPATGRTGRII